MPRTAQLLLPIALILMFVFLTGCAGAPKPNGAHAVVMLDVSRSVKARDEDLVRTALTALSKLPRCSVLTVIPVNARAGGLLDLKLPCERAQYDDDLRAIYQLVKSELPVQLGLWRGSGHQSDYRNAFTLASERLELSPGRILIVLGDMTDDTSAKSPPPPAALDLFPGFHGVKIYLGFLESTSLDRLSAGERETFQNNWRDAFIRAGASDADITVRNFGLQGLEAWSEVAIGPVNPVFEEFTRRTGGRN